MVGTGMLMGNCCRDIVNGHCYDHNETGEHFNHDDHHCDLRFHYVTSTHDLKPVWLAGCDGQWLCPNCARINHDVYGCDGPANKGECPRYIGSGLYIAHALVTCTPSVIPNRSEGKHSFKCGADGLGGGCGFEMDAPFH